MDVAGEWTVTLTLPLGEAGFTMLLVQKGEKLSGHMLSEMGQFELTGSVQRDLVRIEWSFPDGGKTVAVRFAGRARGNSISGAARVGDVGEGQMSAERK